MCFSSFVRFLLVIFRHFFWVWLILIDYFPIFINEILFGYQRLVWNSICLVICLAFYFSFWACLPIGSLVVNMVVTAQQKLFHLSISLRSIACSLPRPSAKLKSDYAAEEQLRWSSKVSAYQRRYK
ncbi:hypothetical protein B0H66DRAFT_221401 [Apodospora peruviana]|uniref:Uncharacterized protein n=1 Tax=Apodospora peruviana TaxID=516989 RepID=A0AAE0I4A3_9PEZI|nr:hypothetical protein B0H66DRAFT_221401 [Apodospora peruviana]